MTRSPMTFDYYAHLDSNNGRASDGTESLMVQFYRSAGQQNERGNGEKGETRKRYCRRANQENLSLPSDFRLEPSFEGLPDPSWVGIEVSFALQSPWYSKDDRLFHVLDNPLRRERVFGVPFLSAASWKGMLRWACRMNAGLFKSLDTGDGRLDGWEDPPWILHLFGNEKGEAENHRAGALAFYPSWFENRHVSCEVINPHCREKRAGRMPIFYEVVSANAKSSLRLLYAPSPGNGESSTAADALKKLADATQLLLEQYGISAKRTAGWGSAKIEEWKAFRRKAREEPVALPPKKQIARSLQELELLTAADPHSVERVSATTLKEFQEKLRGLILRSGHRP